MSLTSERRKKKRRMESGGWRAKGERGALGRAREKGTCNNTTKGGPLAVLHSPV